MYSVKFSEEGFETESAVGGEEGLNRLRGGIEPDVILLDIVMPNIDGFAFIETLKQEGLAPKAKIVVLSNQGQDEEIAKARELGADDYIVKASAIPSEVVAKVMKCIGE
jgi:two-component system chemotaxis response regulator CheY